MVVVSSSTAAAAAAGFRKRNKIFYVTMGYDICDVIFHNFAFCVPHRISIQHASIRLSFYHLSPLHSAMLSVRCFHCVFHR